MLFLRLIFALGSKRMEKWLQNEFGEAFAKACLGLSRQRLREVAAKTPGIGKTVFSFNYAFGPPYIALCRASEDLGRNRVEVQGILWAFNEGLLTLIPKWLIKPFAAAYLRGFRKKLPCMNGLFKTGRCTLMIICLPSGT